jgi:hydroxypyruvate isomerase
MLLLKLHRQKRELLPELQERLKLQKLLPNRGFNLNIIILNMDYSRRNFIKSATATGAAIMAAPAVFGTGAASKPLKATDATTPFKLKYAPGMGMFRQNAGQDPIDNIKFCKDQGFRAMFDNGLPGREPELQEKIASEISRQGMELGP